MNMLTPRRILAVVVITAVAASAACGSDPGLSQPTQQADLASQTVPTPAPSYTMTADEVLEQARSTLHSAQSFEVVQTTTRDRDSGTSSVEIVTRKADGQTAYLHEQRDTQLTEVLTVPGHRYVRYYFTGQDSVPWEESSIGDIPNVEQTPSVLDDLEGPRITGVRDSGGRQVYVLEGATPIPITLGGPSTWAEIEPESYTLEVDAESLEPVSLVYSYISWIVNDGVRSEESRADVTVTVEFVSVNDPVTITPPADAEILQPEDPTPTPDLRYPQWPTPVPFDPPVAPPTTPTPTRVPFPPVGVTPTATPYVLPPAATATPPSPPTVTPSTTGG